MNVFMSSFIKLEEEINRIKEIYKLRDCDKSFSCWSKDIYHPRHPIGKLFNEHNHNILIDALNHLEIDLRNLTILDVGCGEGAWLRFLLELGAKPNSLHGIDLSESRIETAKQINPSINLEESKGDNLPFSSGIFDIVLQVVVFSSITEIELARILLDEMVRVTRPGGYIFWIDHKKSHSATLTGYSNEQLIEWLPNWSLIYQMAVHPRYIRKWFKYPWLCRLLYEFTKNGCDSWFLIFRKEK